MINTEAMSLSVRLMLLDNIEGIVEASKVIDKCSNPKPGIVQAIDYLVPALTIKHDSTFMNIINSVLTDGHCIPTSNYDEVDDAIEEVFNSHIHEDCELSSSNEAISMFREFCSLPNLYEHMSYTTVLFYIFYSAGRTYVDDDNLLTESLVKELVRVAKECTD